MVINHCKVSLQMKPQVTLWYSVINAKHNRYAMANIIWIFAVSMATLAYSCSGKQGFIALFEKFFCSKGIFPLLHTFFFFYWKKNCNVNYWSRRKIFFFFYCHSWVGSELGTWSKANHYKLWLTAAIQNATSLLGEVSKLQRQKPQPLAGNSAMQPFDWLCYFSPVLSEVFDA